MSDVVFGPLTHKCFLRTFHWLQWLQYLPCKICTCKGYDLICSGCIARAVLATRTTTKLALIGIICFYFYSEDHLVYLFILRNISCSIADTKPCPFCGLIPSAVKSPAAQAGCIPPWWAGCCVAIAVWIEFFCKQPLKDNSRSHTTWSQVARKSIFLAWNMGRTVCIWCVGIVWYSKSHSVKIKRSQM